MEILFINFINTNWYNTHRINRELLDDSSWLETFQTKWKLQTEAPAEETDIMRLKELRGFLLEAVKEITEGRALSQEQLTKLNEYLSLAVLSKSVEVEDDKYHTELKSKERNWDWVLHEITASFAELISSEAIKRVKLCENPECRWVFFDESKSKTRRWCDNTCASLIKVRKFRERVNK